MFGFEEATAIVAWGTFTFTQLTSYNAGSSREWYTKNRPDWSPPGWGFPIVWTVLYAACTTAIFYHTQIALADSWQLWVGVMLYIIHMLLNKFWSVLFWDYESPGGALIVLCFMILTGVALIITSALLPSSGTLFWVPVMLESIYMAWLIYAFILNAHWVTN